MVKISCGPTKLDHATNRVMAALKNTFDDERGRWIIKDHKQARSEWALSIPLVRDQNIQSKQDNRAQSAANQVQKVIIDRTFIDGEGTRWIIDYKTSDHHGSDEQAFVDREQDKYESQLNNYAQIISRIEDRKVKVGLYFPMLQSWREWEPSLTPIETSLEV